MRSSALAPPAAARRRAEVDRRGELQVARSPGTTTTVPPAASTRAASSVASARPAWAARRASARKAWGVWTATSAARSRVATDPARPSTLGDRLIVSVTGHRRRPPRPHLRVGQLGDHGVEERARRPAAGRRRGRRSRRRPRRARRPARPRTEAARVGAAGDDGVGAVERQSSQPAGPPGPRRRRTARQRRRPSARPPGCRRASANCF